MYTLNCKGNLLNITQPVVMGIINSTPDSFYANSRADNVDLAVETASKMISAGASIIDIGGQSTRPGSAIVSEIEEINRVLPIINAIRTVFPDIIISIDTFYPSVAKQAVENGANMVNDISGGLYHADMLTTVGSLKVPYICMYSSSTAATMHEKNILGNITEEAIQYFNERIYACKLAGITDLILDPGIGFSKTMEQNFQLIKELEVLKIYNLPILMGISRKSLIYKTLHQLPEESLNGTTVLNTVALMKGASILRVHDVKEAIEAILLLAVLNKTPCTS